ncbi:MAG: hypothetical protein ACJ74J_06990 [Blastocatellia bacterium]
MFGILKTGLKLGVGCFVAGILFVLVIAGLIFYYCGRQPAPHSRNTNRRAAIQQSHTRAATQALMMKAE